MSVYVSNIVIEQGFDFDTSFELADTRTNQPLILTNASAESKLRKHYESESSVSFACTISDPDNGIVSISLNASQTVNLKPGRYVYDLKVINFGKVYKAIEGAAIVRPGVTR